MRSPDGAVAPGWSAHLKLGFTQDADGHRSRSVAGTLLAAGRDMPQALLDEARASVADHTGAARIALTRLPQLLAARYLGDSGEQAKELFIRIWGVLRPALTGSTAIAPRLWAT